MTDFKLDPLTGDLDVSEGVQLVRQGEDAAQRVSLALGLNLGEWFANIFSGLPFIRNNDEDFSESIRFMLGDKFSDSPGFITSTLTKYLENQTFIKSVTATSEFDNRTRKYTYTADIIGVDGVEITITPFEAQL